MTNDTNDQNSTPESDEITQVVKFSNRNYWIVGLFILTVLLFVALLIRVTSMSGGVDAMKKDLTKDMALVKSDVAALKTDHTIIKADVTTLQTDVSTLDKKVRGVIMATDSLIENANALTDKVAALTDDVATKAEKTDLSRLATISRLKRVENKLDTYIAVVEDLTPSVNPESQPTATTDDGTITVIVQPVPIEDDSK